MKNFISLYENALSSEECKFIIDYFENVPPCQGIKEDRKNYEEHLKLLSDTKLSTDKFFEKVKVNDDNNDLKNNRLELLQILCSTFNTFVDFSKLEGS